MRLLITKEKRDLEDSSCASANLADILDILNQAIYDLESVEVQSGANKPKSAPQAPGKSKKKVFIGNK